MRRILAVIRSHGALNIWAISNAVGRSHTYCQRAVTRLVEKARLKEMVIRRRRFYVVPTRTYLECQCDGTCKQQIVTLANPHHRRLYRHLNLNGPIRFHDLLSKNKADLGWNERTLQRRLGRLVATALVSKHGAADDLRSTIYEAIPPVDPAHAILRKTSWVRTGRENFCQ